jgi:hypothetical protein
MPQHASNNPRNPLVLFSFLFTFAVPVASLADARVSEGYGRLPLHFEANQGQTHKDVRFLARGPGYGLYLTADEAVLVLTRPEAKRDVRGTSEPQAKPVALRMSLVGAARKPHVSGVEELPGKANYFIGKDQSKWRTEVPTYARVHYREVYPGIDLVYYGNQRQLEYDFVVAPGADPSKIVLGFKGADKLEIDAGNLVLHVGGSEIRQHKPVIYQEIDGVRREIDGGYVLKGAKRVGFQLAAYDHQRPLVIDPVLAYSTYLGGSNNDTGDEIAVDATGAVYVTGTTRSADFPATAGAFDATANENFFNVFVTKLDPTGSALVYSTFLGGNRDQFPFAIAIDATGAAYVTGATSSTDFPTTAGAFQPSFGGGGPFRSLSDAFLTKLDATGSALVYSTYLGGSDDDRGTGIALDAAGNAYVSGSTRSSNFPTTPGAFNTSFNTAHNDFGLEGFVTKVNPTGSALIYSTFLSVVVRGARIAVDAAGAAYVAGTSIRRFATDSSIQRGFVTKLDAGGGALVYSTFLGPEFTHEVIEATDIAVDATGAAYVTGSTRSADFPTTAGAFDTSFNGSIDAFATKLDAVGALVYSTFLGGSRIDEGRRIAVDATGAAYVTGITESSNFPTTPGAFDTSFNGGSGGFATFDIFVTKLDATGAALRYSTYLGGSKDDLTGGLAVDSTGSAYVSGSTQSIDFPTTPGAFRTSQNGGQQDAFVTKLALGTVLLVIDKNGIDDKTPPNFFSPFQVNDDVAAIGVRAQLRFFRDQVGQTIILPAGALGDEGWFALKTIPQSWAPAGGVAGYIGNPAANPEDPSPQGTGPGLGSPDANGDPDSLLHKVPDVTPLRATALSNLIGREVCAVVYDHQVGINQDQRTGDLRGANLGTVAFQVLSLAPSTDASPLSLPNVEVRIRDARTLCKGPFALLTDAEAPAGAPLQ